MGPQQTCRVTSKTLTTALVLFSNTLMMASSLQQKLAMSDRC